MKKSTDDQLAEIRAALEAKKTEAREAWAKLDGTKKAAIAAGEKALDPESAEFLALDEAGKVYDGLRDEVERMEATYRRLAEVTDLDQPTSRDAQRQAASPRQGEVRDALKDGVARFMAAYHEWSTAVAPNGGLANPKTRFGGSPEIELISRDDFVAAVTQTTAYPSLPGRRPGIVPLITQPIDVLDVIPMVPVSTDTVEFVYEKTFTNTAVETAEADAAGEGTVELDKTSVSISWLPFTLPATRQLLADEPRMQAFIQDRLLLGIRQRLQTEVIDGNGTPPNIKGMLNWSGVLTQDSGAFAKPDIIHKAKTAIRIATKMAYEPNVLCMHPADYEELALSKSTTSGDYYFGGPQADSVTVWGLVPIVSTAVSEGNPFVFASQAVELYVREGITVQVSDSHDDHFVKGIVDFLASGRFGLGVLQPKGICEITDFDS